MKGGLSQHCRILDEDHCGEYAWQCSTTAKAARPDTHRAKAAAAKSTDPPSYSRKDRERTASDKKMLKHARPAINPSSKEKERSRCSSSRKASLSAIF